MLPDLQRYSCQMNLPGFGEAMQQRLLGARVLVVGAGGLGCPAAQYLASSGVGNIGIADFDNVSTGNLHRQILFNPEDVGKNKALIACDRLLRQNAGIDLVPHTEKITSDNVLPVIADYDIIVDCTDNFETRYLLNDAAVLSDKPLVYGAIYQYEGQVAVWNMPNTDGSRTPNYRDLYPEVNAAQIPNCSVGGVIPTLAGIIGCMQANEVLKFIVQAGDLLACKVLIFDALSMQSRVIKIGKVTSAFITHLPQTADLEMLSADKLKELLNDDSLALIDVRTIQERDLDDIGGDHIPLDELEENMSELSADKTVVFYCATGKRSGEAVKLVKRYRPEIKALSLAGGLEQWNAEQDRL